MTKTKTSVLINTTFGTSSAILRSQHEYVEGKRLNDGPIHKKVKSSIKVSELFQLTSEVVGSYSLACITPQSSPVPTKLRP